jgi:release factor glutamine methyltransferase
VTERVRDILFDVQRRLQTAGIPSPEVDAAELVAFALKVPRTALYLHDPVSDEQAERIEELTVQRISRVPLQHIIGTAGFRRMNLRVGPGVFIPRPETELVAEAAIRFLRDQDPQHRIAVDLCSGSGAIAFALATEVDQVDCYAVEISPDAVAWADVNLASAAPMLAERSSRVQVITGDATTIADVGEPLEHLAGRVAVVTCNPPYIPDGMVPREPEVQAHDPALALYGGPDGYAVIREVVHTAAHLLAPGGLLVIEHGEAQGGHDGVPALLREWSDVHDRVDLAGRPRFVMAVRR